MQIFEKDGHTIFNGDALEILSNQINDNSIDLIFVDPPYNIGKNFNGRKDKWETDKKYLDWSYFWIELLIKKLKPTGSLYIMTSTQFMPFYDIYLQDKQGLKLQEILTKIHQFYCVFQAVASLPICFHNPCIKGHLLVYSVFGNFQLGNFHNFLNNTQEYNQ